jgi:DNA-binding response OmpR family regulator
MTMPHLLLIEDNQHIQRIFREKFLREGFHVTTADNGQQALQLLRQLTPDAVLLDIMLPKLSGFELLQQLRADPHLSRIPVFMLSNRSFPDDVHHALSLGARQFYSKGSTSLQDIVLQIRAECGFKKIILTTRNAESAQPIVSVLQHPRLLCAVNTVLAELATAVERGAPDLVVLDARPPAPHAFTVLQQLKTTATTRCVPVIAITDQPNALLRADGFVDAESFTTQLRPVVLNLLGLADPADLPAAVQA